MCVEASTCSYLNNDDDDEPENEVSDVISVCVYSYLNIIKETSGYVNCFWRFFL